MVGSGKPASSASSWRSFCAAISSPSALITLNVEPGLWWAPPSCCKAGRRRALRAGLVRSWSRASVQLAALTSPPPAPAAASTSPVSVSRMTRPARRACGVTCVACPPAQPAPVQRPWRMPTHSRMRWLSACNGRSSVSVAATGAPAVGKRASMPATLLACSGPSPSNGARPAALAASVGAPSFHNGTPWRSASRTGDGAATGADVPPASGCHTSLPPATRR